MKKKVLGIIIVLVVLMLSPAACSKGSTTANPLSNTTTSATISATNKTVPPTSTTSKSSASTSTGNGLSDLLGKAANVAYYSCQVSMTSGGTTQNMNEWIKTGNPSKLRMETTAAGQSTVIIYDGQNYYTYMPAANIAYQMSAAETPNNNLTGNISSLPQTNPVLVGSDTVNGMACTVYQYTVQGVSAKVWIWNQYGLPAQMVLDTTTIVYSNYSFSAIADSMFQLPSGVTVTAMPTTP